LRAKADNGYPPAEKKESYYDRKTARREEGKSDHNINPPATSEIKKEKAEVNISSSRSL